MGQLLTNSHNVYREASFADLEQNLQSIMGLGSSSTRKTSTMLPPNLPAATAAGQETEAAEAVTSLPAPTNSRFVISVVNDRTSSTSDPRPTYLTLDGQGNKGRTRIQ